MSVSGLGVDAGDAHTKQQYWRCHRNEFQCSTHGASPEMLEAPLSWPLFAWLVRAVFDDFIPAPSALYGLSCCKFPRCPVRPRLAGRLEPQGLWRGLAGLGCKWIRSGRSRKYEAFSHNSTTKINDYIILMCIRMSSQRSALRSHDRVSHRRNPNNYFEGYRTQITLDQSCYCDVACKNQYDFGI